MNRGLKFVLGLSVVFLVPSSVFAHPPSSIDLQYDKKNQKLLIDVHHVSQKGFRHYIEKIQITKNNEAPVVNYYRQQVDPNEFQVAVPLQAKAGDAIKVEAFSNQGGSTSETLEITKEVLEKAVKPFAPASRAKSTIPQDSDKISPAVPTDPEVAHPTVPNDPKKIRPATTMDSSVLSPAVPEDPSISKSTIPNDPSQIKSTIPEDSSDQRPAVPQYP